MRPWSRVMTSLNIQPGSILLLNFVAPKFQSPWRRRRGEGRWLSRRRKRRRSTPPTSPAPSASTAVGSPAVPPPATCAAPASSLPPPPGFVPAHPDSALRYGGPRLLDRRRRTPRRRRRRRLLWRRRWRRRWTGAWCVGSGWDWLGSGAGAGRCSAASTVTPTATTAASTTRPPPGTRSPGQIPSSEQPRSPGFKKEVGNCSSFYQKMSKCNPNSMINLCRINEYI